MLFCPKQTSNFSVLGQYDRLTNGDSSKCELPCLLSVQARRRTEGRKRHGEARCRESLSQQATSARLRSSVSPAPRIWDLFDRPENKIFQHPVSPDPKIYFAVVMFGAAPNNLLALLWSLWRERMKGEAGALGFFPHPRPLPRTGEGN